MRDTNITYCGLYCENCYQRTNVGPEAKKLYESLKRLGYEHIIHLIPKFEDFWSYLSDLANSNGCKGCQSCGGNRYCKMRVCAQEKGIDVCALCDEYPCKEYKDFITAYPMLKADNLFLREYGLDLWLKMQLDRRSQGYTYTDAKENGNV